jgi:hypothetical protein
LPSAGVITVDSTSILTLTTDVFFQPECTGTREPFALDPGDVSSATGLRDPFYTSTLPQTYALAAATVLSYMLVIMLIITPRTTFFGHTTLARRGLIGRASDNDALVGVGTRPWLQKVATLTVVISLTIASADTFNVAKDQYLRGFMNAGDLQDAVAAGLEIRIVRVISDTFLWLAQVQTLIRLFPRHKEKVIIKWIGFALIILDTIFSILNSFVYAQTTRPQSFVEAVPALSYLFQLALSLLYAAWVIYYSISKRKFAFYHARMRNICIVAVISLTSVLVPVVFFVLDISKPNFAGWGDYVRWVGAAAASVAVWEWVERIEALEREDRKDGVLGREIFDGDEMLETTPSEEVNWPGNRWIYGGDDDDRGEGGFSSAADSRWKHPAHRHAHDPLAQVRQVVGQTIRPLPSQPPAAAIEAKVSNTADPVVNVDQTIPPSIPTPISRGDTTSPVSTVYTVQYHPVSEPTPPPQQHISEVSQEALEESRPAHSSEDPAPRILPKPERSRSRWRAPKQLFRRHNPDLPPEISRNSVFPERPHYLDQLPVIVIPAQSADGRTWSPAAALPENEGEGNGNSKGNSRDED